MAEELLINVGIGGDNVNKLSQDVEKFGTTVEQTAQGMQKLGNESQQANQKQESLRTQIRKGREELALMTRGTDEYNAKLSEVSGKLAKFNLINKELKASQATLAQTMTNLNNVVGGITGGFSVATGVMNLFGVENEATMKNLVKMQALLSITSGLASLNTAMRSFSGLKAVFGDLFKSTKTASDAVSELNMANNTASNSAGTLAKESTVIASNLAGVGAATNAAANASNAAAAATNAAATANANLIASNSTLEAKYISLKNLENSYNMSRLQGNEREMSSIGKKISIQKEAISITESLMTEEEILNTKLAVAKTYLNDAIKVQKQAQIELNNVNAEGNIIDENSLKSAKFNLLYANSRVTKASNEVKAIEEKIEAQKALTKTEVIDTEAKVTNTDATVKNTEAQIENAEAQEAVGKVVESNAGKLLKQIGTLLGWAAALYVVIAGISWLVKKMNEIPKDLELKIKINEDSLDEVKKIKETYSEIKNEQDMANKARAAGDMATTRQIESNIGKILNKVKDGAAEEYKLAKNKDAFLQKIFENELERQKKLAFNTSLFKQRAEAELNKEAGEEEERLIREQLIGDEVEKYKKEHKNAGNGEVEAYKKKVTNEIDSDLKALSQTYNGDDTTFFTSVYTTIVGALGKLSTGILKAYNKAQDKIASAKKEIELYDKIQPKDAYQHINGDNESGSSSESVSSSVPDSRPKLEKIEEYDKAFLAIEETFVSKYKGISAEQQAINDSELEQTGKFLGASEHQRLVYEKNIEDKRLLDLNNEKKYVSEQLETLKTKRDLTIKNNEETLEFLRVAFSDQLAIIKTSEGKIAKLNKEIFDNENSIYKLEVKLKTAKTKDEKQHYQNEIDELKKSNNRKKAIRDTELESLKKLKEEGDKLLKDKAKVESDLAEAIKSGANIDDLLAKLDEINSKIVASSAKSSKITRDLWLDAFDDVDKGIQQIGKTLSSLSSINDMMMQSIDNKTSYEKNQLELSDSYRKASNDKQAQMMYELDKKNYESKKNLFETKKNYDIGVVAVEAASSEMGAVKNLIEDGGPISPIAWASFAMESAMIVATAAASISEISSRQLDAPVPPNSSSSVSASQSIALNPQKTATTSREENLNMMNRNAKNDYVVKVTDINNVQNTVSVRDKNSTY